VLIPADDTVIARRAALFKTLISEALVRREPPRFEPRAEAPPNLPAAPLDAYRPAISRLEYRTPSRCSGLCIHVELPNIPTAWKFRKPSKSASSSLPRKPPKDHTGPAVFFGDRSVYSSPPLSPKPAATRAPCRYMPGLPARPSLRYLTDEEYGQLRKKIGLPRYSPTGPGGSEYC
jgi:hypothetical protein